MQLKLDVEIMTQLRSENIALTNPEAWAIAGQLRQSAFGDEVLESYRSGFIVMGFLALAVSVLTLLIMWRTQPVRGVEQHAVDM